MQILRGILMKIVANLNKGVPAGSFPHKLN